MHPLSAYVNTAICESKIKQHIKTEVLFTTIFIGEFNKTQNIKVAITARLQQNRLKARSGNDLYGALDSIYGIPGRKMG